MVSQSPLNLAVVSTVLLLMMSLEGVVSRRRYFKKFHDNIPYQILKLLFGRLFSVWLSRIGKQVFILLSDGVGE